MKTDCWEYIHAQFSPMYTGTLLPFIHTVFLSVCHLGLSRGSNRSSNYLKYILLSLFHSLYLQPLCVTSDRENVLENYCLLDGIADNCRVPEPQGRRRPLLSKLHRSMTVLAPLFLFFFLSPHHPLIITKAYLLFEGGPLIKAPMLRSPPPPTLTLTQADSQSSSNKLGGF